MVENLGIVEGYYGDDVVECGVLIGFGKIGNVDYVIEVVC